MKKLIFTFMAVFSVIAVNAKTLIVYYSYTNNVERIVTELRSQIEADVVEIEPAEKGLDYAANNYAIGSTLISAIRNNPGDASSYSAIDPVNVNLADYDCIIIGAPLWWSNMAAPLQTYLFHNGSQMAEKKNRTHRFKRKQRNQRCGVGCAPSCTRRGFTFSKSVDTFLSDLKLSLNDFQLA